MNQPINYDTAAIEVTALKTGNVLLERVQGIVEEGNQVIEGLQNELQTMKVDQTEDALSQLKSFSGITVAAKKLVGTSRTSDHVLKEITLAEAFKQQQTGDLMLKARKQFNLAISEVKNLMEDYYKVMTIENADHTDAVSEYLNFCLIDYISAYENALVASGWCNPYSIEQPLFKGSEISKLSITGSTLLEKKGRQLKEIFE